MPLPAPPLPLQSVTVKPESAIFWVVFNLLVLAVLTLDLALFNRQPHAPRLKSAIGWTLFWVLLAVAFGAWIAYDLGHTKALEFATGYVVEESLSVDNLFIFLLIFSYFKVPAEHQRKVLFWGILGALVFRGLFIWAGVSLIERFRWIIYAFGAFLIYSGLRMMVKGEAEVQPENNWALKIFRRFFPVTPSYEGGRFFAVHHGARCATPLLLVLLVVETTDVLFATDSIPAVLAITTDPFIVYTSNVFAILGLRSLYFVLASLMQLFHLLHYGIAGILIFVGIKMIVASWFAVPTVWALVVIAAILTLSIVLSMALPRPPAKESAST